MKVLRNKLVVRRLITFELIMFLSASGAVAAGIAAECVVPILLVCRLAVAVYPACRVGLSVLCNPIASGAHVVIVRGSSVPASRMFRKSRCMPALSVSRMSSEPVRGEAMSGGGVTAHSM
jgi:hypothetical protein